MSGGLSLFAAEFVGCPILMSRGAAFLAGGPGFLCTEFVGCALRVSGLTALATSFAFAHFLSHKSFLLNVVYPPVQANRHFSRLHGQDVTNTNECIGAILKLELKLRPVSALPPMLEYRFGGDARDTYIRVYIVFHQKLLCY
jgi:hypothetical protein